MDTTQFSTKLQDPLTGVKDDDNNGLVDDLINYQLYASGSESIFILSLANRCQTTQVAPGM